MSWYESFGFEVDGPEYDDDGIPHVPMVAGAEPDAPRARAKIGDMRRARLTVAVFGILTLVGIGATAATAVALSRPAQQTTLPGETTTLAPTTAAPTTTVAPTTTAQPATTTTEASTTTSSSTTTTTVAPAPAATKDSNSKAGRVIIGILLVLAAAAITALIVVRRNAKRDTAEWTNSAASALRDADLTRDMLASEARPGQPEDAARVTAVRDTVDRVATTFEQLATNAPAEDMRSNAIAVATSLRGYFFALEAEQMLHNAPTPPTGEQLATADAAKRTRAADLDAAITSIRAYLEPKPAGQ